MCTIQRLHTCDTARGCVDSAQCSVPGESVWIVQTVGYICACDKLTHMMVYCCRVLWEEILGYDKRLQTFQTVVILCNRKGWQPHFTTLRANTPTFLFYVRIEVYVQLPHWILPSTIGGQETKFLV